MNFLRGNALTVSGSFWSDVQPTNAVCTLRYHDLNGNCQTATVVLTSVVDTWTDDDGNVHTATDWSGSWDTSVVGSGRVDWVVQGSGALVAATGGHFNIDAPFEQCGDHNDEFRS